MNHMILPMLVVDKNIEVSQREQDEWKKHGIDTIRVDTMQEAIEKLTKESFLFTVINADTINYLPLLKVMRAAAPTFVFIITSNYSAQKEVDALHNGADVYTKFNENVELNVQLALAQLLRCNERDKQPTLPPGMIIYEKFLVVSNERRIYYSDERLKLTKKEYDILHYFIVNHDCTLAYEQVYDKIWCEKIADTSHKSLWNFINRLRKKISLVGGDREYFETERNVGYRFSARIDK